MMLATISSTTFDPSGYIELDADPASVLGGERRRRANRIATLDGGVAINDFGYADGDRTIDLTWQPRAAAVEDNVQRLLALYPRLQVSVRSGVFLAAPETFTPGTDSSRLRLLVISKLST